MITAIRRLFCLGLLPLLAACSHSESRTAEHVELLHYRNIFVQHLLTDGHSIDELIARNLRHRGYSATAGPLTMLPPDTEIIVTYEDHWNFDFTTYMIELDLQVRENRTGKLLATATYFKPSVVGRSPVDMVDAVVSKLFKPKGTPIPDPAPDPGIESVSPSQ